MLQNELPSSGSSRPKLEVPSIENGFPEATVQQWSLSRRFNRGNHCVAIAGYWVATTCHLPLGIFTQVSVQRAYSAKGFPASVPVPLYLAVAMAVSPNTVTFRSSFFGAGVPARLGARKSLRLV